jgi:hypothetical protein
MSAPAACRPPRELGTLPAVRRDVTITIASGRVQDLDAIVAAVRAAGGELRAVLPTLGLLSVTVEERAFARLRAVPGVAAVEEETSVETSDPLDPGDDPTEPGTDGLSSSAPPP